MFHIILKVQILAIIQAFVNCQLTLFLLRGVKCQLLIPNFASMNIFLTYDYELFFGESTGTVEKCLIEPTERLLDLSNEFKIKMTFFVDVGYLIKLEEFSKQFSELKKDQEKILKQLNAIVSSGNDIQLHIHPHWERSYYQDGKWQIVTNGTYKLADFSDAEIVQIVKKYKTFIDNLIGRKTTTFRAGGWCIQPFSKLSTVFKELEIKYDSSVFPGGKFSSDHYSFDFIKAPKKAHYRFDLDECEEVLNGFFTEYPISSMNYSPLFYWRLYILGRLFPSQHKMLGDGNFLAQPGRKKSVLTNFTWNHVSTDGYYSSKLGKCLLEFEKSKFTDMVIIGHPKSMTNYSFKKLQDFLHINHTKHDFITFKDLL